MGYGHSSTHKMHVFKTKLLEFINELLVLFEDKNKIVYRRLIHYHHQIKNKLTDDDLYEVAIEFLSHENVRGMISTHNHRIMKGIRRRPGREFFRLHTTKQRPDLSNGCRRSHTYVTLCGVAKNEGSFVPLQSSFFL